jgi:hypothetical protein
MPIAAILLSSIWLTFCRHRQILRIRCQGYNEGPKQRLVKKAENVRCTSWECYDAYPCCREHQVNERIIGGRRMLCRVRQTWNVRSSIILFLYAFEIFGELVEPKKSKSNGTIHEHLLSKNDRLALTI